MKNNIQNDPSDHNTPKTQPAPRQFADQWEYVRALHEAGHNLLPISTDGKRAPLVDWKIWQTERQPDDFIRHWWGPAAARQVGIGVVCGTPWLHLELFDFDHESAIRTHEFGLTVKASDAGLLDSLTVHQSPKGFHLFFRCMLIDTPGNKVLATNGKAGKERRVFIETRGRGGWAMLPFSPAACHPKGGTYHHRSGPQLDQVGAITIEDRELLINAARLHNVVNIQWPKDQPDNPGWRAGDDYNHNGPDWEELLAPHGWRCVRQEGAVRFWARPDKDGKGWSATTGHCHGPNGEELFYVFSSNAGPFQASQAYGKFRVYALLNCGGKLSDAARQLGEQGFGDPSLRPGSRRSRVPVPGAPPPGSPAPTPSPETNGQQTGDHQEQGEQTGNQTPAKQPLSPSEAAQFVARVQALGAEFFHNEAGETWVAYDRRGKREVAPVDSREVSRYLRHLKLSEDGTTFAALTLQTVVTTIDTLAAMQGPTHPVHSRVAAHEGRFYLDLADEERNVVRLSPAGWDIITNPPVYFRRRGGMLALPLPGKRCRIDDLRKWVNLQDDEQWLLFKVWLVHAFWPLGEKMPLILTGPQGAGKSTAAQLICSLVDPNSAGLRAEPHNYETLAIAAQHQWLLPFDNVSNVQPWLSDALCRLATGGSISFRKHHSNDEQVVFTAIRPMIVTSIVDVADRADLLSRSFLAELLPLPEGQRLSRDVFWKEWEDERPRFLAELLQLVCCAMGNLPKGRLCHQHRMTDFVRIGQAMGPAAGFTAEQFAAALDTLQRSGHALAREADPLVPVLEKFLETHPNDWEGPAGKLLDELRLLASAEDQKAARWPKTPRGLRAALKRLAPALLDIGIEVDPPSRASDNRRTRLVTIRPRPSTEMA